MCSNMRHLSQFCDTKGNGRKRFLHHPQRRPPPELQRLRGVFEGLVDRQRQIWRRERGPEDPPASGRRRQGRLLAAAHPHLRGASRALRRRRHPHPSLLDAHAPGGQGDPESRRLRVGRPRARRRLRPGPRQHELLLAPGRAGHGAGLPARHDQHRPAPPQPPAVQRHHGRDHVEDAGPGDAAAGGRAPLHLEPRAGDRPKGEA